MLMQLKLIAAIAVGGGLGALLRHLFVLTGHALLSPLYVWPWGTLFANVFGGFGIGVVYVIASPLLHPDKSQLAWNFWAIGVMGGFTTFSSFSMEAFHLFERKGALGGLSYVVISVTLAISAFYLGMVAARNVGVSQ